MEGRASVKEKQRLGLEVTSDDGAASCTWSRAWALAEESELGSFFLLKPEDVLFWDPHFEKQNEGLE